MTKADFPELSIDKAISAIELFESKLKGKTESKDAFAELLGYKSAKNGAFLHKLGDLRKYGLITPRGAIELTDLARKIIYYNSQEERNESILEAIKTVELFGKLIDTLGNAEADEEDIKVQLQHTGMERAEAHNNKGKISRIYNSFLPYISKGNLPKRSDNKMASIPMASERQFTGQTTHTTQMTPTFTYNDTPDEIAIRFKPSELHFGFARKTLEELEKKYKKEQKATFTQDTIAE